MQVRASGPQLDNDGGLDRAERAERRGRGACGDFEQHRNVTLNAGDGAHEEQDELCDRLVVHGAGVHLAGQFHQGQQGLDDARRGELQLIEQQAEGGGDDVGILGGDLLRDGGLQRVGQKAAGLEQDAFKELTHGRVGQAAHAVLRGEEAEHERHADVRRGEERHEQLGVALPHRVVKRRHVAEVEHVVFRVDFGRGRELGRLCEGLVAQQGGLAGHVLVLVANLDLVVVGVDLHLRGLTGAVHARRAVGQLLLRRHHPLQHDVLVAEVPVLLPVAADDARRPLRVEGEVHHDLPRREPFDDAHLAEELLRRLAEVEIVLPWEHNVRRWDVIGELAVIVQDRGARDARLRVNDHGRLRLAG